MSNYLLYNFAAKSRPRKVIGCLENITSLAEHDNYEILLKIDTCDYSCNNIDFLAEVSRFPNIVVTVGESKSKISAINRNLPWNDKWDILINMSDDQLFLVKGFDKIIIDRFEEAFEDTDGVIHFPDSNAGERLMTMSIIGRKYFDRTGYVYNPEYTSLYSDNEAMEVAKILGKYKYCPEKIQNHFHPAWGLAEMDDQYRHTESFYHIDRQVYNKRKTINFGLDAI